MNTKQLTLKLVAERNCGRFLCLHVFCGSEVVKIIFTFASSELLVCMFVSLCLFNSCLVLKRFKEAPPSSPPHHMKRNKISKNHFMRNVAYLISP